MANAEISSNAYGSIRVLVADDHPVVRNGLVAVLLEQPDLALAAEAENGARAVELYRELHPDVCLIDLRMPVMDGVGAIRTITTEDPAARILALTTYEGDADIRRALEAGARGLSPQGHASYRSDPRGSCRAPR
jgi:DNA-binding NarL/FixJ family response regulator